MGEPVMLALTLWPGPAWAICHAGKLVENRSWHPGNRLPVGSRLAIHAGKHLGGRAGSDAAIDGIDAVAAMWRLANAERPGLEMVAGILDTPKSAIVAVATIAGFDREQRTGWDAPGTWHWRLRDVEVLSEPIPHRGAQGLWAPSPSALDALRLVLQPAGGAP